MKYEKLYIKRVTCLPEEKEYINVTTLDGKVKYVPSQIITKPRIAIECISETDEEITVFQPVPDGNDPLVKQFLNLLMDAFKNNKPVELEINWNFKL